MLAVAALVIVWRYSYFAIIGRYDLKERLNTDTAHWFLITILSYVFLTKLSFLLTTSTTFFYYCCFEERVIPG